MGHGTTKVKFEACARGVINFARYRYGSSHGGAEFSGDALHRPWQERHAAEVMHPASITVTPTTSVAAAAQILVERGLNCLPIVKYDDAESREPNAEDESPAVLVGLHAFARLPEREHQLLLSIAKSPDCALTLAHTHGGEIVGQVTLAPGSDWWEGFENVYEVTIEVSSNWRGSGIGRHLLDFALELDALEDMILFAMGYPGTGILKGYESLSRATAN